MPCYLIRSSEVEERVVSAEDYATAVEVYVAALCAEWRESGDEDENDAEQARGWIESVEQVSRERAIVSAGKSEPGSAVVRLSMVSLGGVLSIVGAVEAGYPRDVFPDPVKGEVPSVDRVTAAGVRLACQRIREELLAKVKGDAVMVRKPAATGPTEQPVSVATYTGDVDPYQVPDDVDRAEPQPGRDIVGKILGDVLRWQKATDERLAEIGGRLDDGDEHAECLRLQLADTPSVGDLRSLAARAEELARRIPEARAHAQNALDFARLVGRVEALERLTLEFPTLDTVRELVAEFSPFGRLMKARRVALGLTVGDAALRAGWGPAAWSRIELGERLPSAGSLTVIESVLGPTSEWAK